MAKKQNNKHLNQQQMIITLLYLKTVSENTL